MRLRNNPNALKEIKDFSKYIIVYEEGMTIDWNKQFNNNLPISLEVGCGKGDFSINMAIENPDTNFIAIEMYPTVLHAVIKKLKDKEINNIKFLLIDARNIPEVFKENSVKDIYLNFSDPWPKARHAKRRLTYKTFLDLYCSISKEGNLIFKTDNIGLFEWSLEHIEEYPLEITWKTFDLWKEDTPNIRTEYETKFGNKGFKINKLIAKLKK